MTEPETGLQAHTSALYSLGDAFKNLGALQTAAHPSPEQWRQAEAFLMVPEGSLQPVISGASAAMASHRQRFSHAAGRQGFTFRKEDALTNALTRCQAAAALGYQPRSTTLAPEDTFRALLRETAATLGESLRASADLIHNIGHAESDGLQAVYRTLAARHLSGAQALASAFHAAYEAHGHTLPEPAREIAACIADGFADAAATVTAMMPQLQETLGTPEPGGHAAQVSRRRARAAGPER